MSSSGVSCSFVPYITSRCLCDNSCGLLGAGVSILEENFGNVSVHGDAPGPIAVPGIIIPSKVNSCKFCSFPVCGDIIVLFESLQEMEGVFFAHIFGAEVVNE